MELREVFEPIISFIKNLQKKERENSKVAAKERLKLVLMQDRASVSPDFFEMMKKEIIEVIKKYIDIDEEALEVQLTRGFEDGLEGPALYANIPIKNIKPIAKQKEESKEQKSEEVKVEECNNEDKQEKQEENVNIDIKVNEEDINNDLEVKENKEEENIEDNTKILEEESAKKSDDTKQEPKNADSIKNTSNSNKKTTSNNNPRNSSNSKNKKTNKTKK